MHLHNGQLDIIACSVSISIDPSLLKSYILLEIWVHSHGKVFPKMPCFTDMEIYLFFAEI